MLNRLWERTKRGGSASLDESTRIRSFANEDILFYVKRIDNSRVVRAADPASRSRALKLAASMFGAAVLLIGVLLPGAYGLMAGYHIQSLERDNQRLTSEKASLELEESKLLSPARMEELAREQQFVDPAPQKVVYLDGSPASLADAAFADQGGR
jgi:cell division protein FtsL